ncbi:MAG: 4-hydroxy-3-methylbut-2-enyl diphosphate reductase [Nitrospirae bacterium]|nr:4-hydroxy-3-methylbut-2-enyl diphosphate reductase [Nitrospirota bacterium]MBI4838021.1 4-hydroxy-3-methylbut-2-enyl diphosphate reductase [Nitrospirota bacterium]
MQIIVAKNAGVCFGVKRAIDITFALAKDSAGIYTLGPLIHNPQVISKLISQGVAPTEDVHSQKIKTLIIRTHGISPQLYEEISKIGYKIVDATCPFVKKAQKYAQTLKEEGYQVLIVGDKEHPEVQALLGFAGDNVLVVNSGDPLPPLKNRVGIIVQTTQPFEALKKIVSGVLGIAKEVKVYNTICNSTSQRLEETKNLAKEVDAMVIVGGKNSANTTQLARLSGEICAKVYFIEDAGELREEWFKGVEKVGVTGGASTPAWIIDRVVAKLSEISVKT